FFEVSGRSGLHPRAHETPTGSNEWTGTAAGYSIFHSAGVGPAISRSSPEYWIKRIGINRLGPSNANGCGMPFTGQLSHRSAAGRTWVPDKPPKSTRVG